MFARRYRGIPSERLSFNLMNEPGQVEPRAYVAVVRKLVEAIRDEDPDRLIISDGLQWGTVPVLELRELHIAQATRGYTPMEISHYKASWVRRAFPDPQWPRLLPPNGTLLSPQKRRAPHPARDRRSLRDGYRVASPGAHGFGPALLVVEADGKPVFRKEFRCGPGKGEWKKAEFKQEWRIYQNLFDRDYTATIPAGTKQLRLRVADGDWLEIGQLGLKPASAGAKEATLALKQEWGKRPEPFRYAGGSFMGLAMQDRAWLWKTCIEPWKKAELQGIGVMVGEWGVYNKTPHDVVLRWAEDCLRNWQEAGWGWALWNFRGAIGVLDSGRADVRYEDFEGHKLDRKFMDLLQRY